MDDLSSTDLVERWRAGDQGAATELWRRYAERLLVMARRHLSTRLSRYVDPEDVVQSAYRSFFAGTRNDRYVLRHSGDLWRLLVAITLHKLQHQVRRHTTAKRNIRLEQRLGEEGDLIHLQARLLTRDPSPLEAVALVDELEQVLQNLTAPQRTMVELRLQGYTLAEIALNTQTNERTVRRVLKRVTHELRRRCTAHAEP